MQICEYLRDEAQAIARAVDQRETKLKEEATTRSDDVETARRMAVEQLLMKHGLLEYRRNNKLPYFVAGTRT